MPMTAPPIRIAGLGLLAALLSSLAVPTLAQTPVRGSSVPCGAGAITGPGTRPGQTLVLCGSLQQRAPALAAQLTRANAAARDEETRRDLQRFGDTLNSMARRLKPQDTQALADAVAARLQQGASPAQGDSALVNEMDRLRLSLREMNQKIDALREQPGLQARTDSALQGEAGQALARLDFDTARGMLDSLQRIESKIDDAQGPYAANPALLAMVRSEALTGLDKAGRAQAASLCARGWSSLGTLKTAADALQQQGKLNAAGLAYKDLQDRAAQVLNELSARASIKRVQQDSERQLAQIQQAAQQASVASATSAFERRRTPALAQARTPALRARVADADAMRTQAEKRAAQGDYLGAADLLIDGANLLGRVESEGGNYRMPLEDMPKFHRRQGAVGAAIAPAAEVDDADLPAGGACS